MRLCPCILVLLLCDIVLANVCNSLYDHPVWISSDSIERVETFETSPGSSDNHYSVSTTGCRISFEAPSPNQHVVLNFTNIHGLRLAISAPSTQSSQEGTSRGTLAMETTTLDDKHKTDRSQEMSCSPELLILELLPSGMEMIMNRFCGAVDRVTDSAVEISDKNSIRVPAVFQSKSHSVIIRYKNPVKQPQDHRSFFNLSVSFQASNSSSVTTSPVISTGNTVLSSVYTSSASTNAIIAIVLSVLAVIAFSVLVAFCTLLHRDRHASVAGGSYGQGMQDSQRSLHGVGSVGDSSDRAHQSSSSEVVYVPSTFSAMESAVNREAQQSHERRILLRSAAMAEALNLPPQIAVSRDGESGYHRTIVDPASAAHLLVDEHQVIPPNRTVFDSKVGSAPPPPSSGTSARWTGFLCKGSPPAYSPLPPVSHGPRTASLTSGGYSQRHSSCSSNSTVPATGGSRHQSMSSPVSPDFANLPANFDSLFGSCNDDTNISNL